MLTVDEQKTSLSLRPWSICAFFARFYHRVDRHCPLQTVALYLIFFVKSHQMRFLTTFSSRVLNALVVWNTSSMNFAAKLERSMNDAMTLIASTVSRMTSRWRNRRFHENDVVESGRVNIVQKTIANGRESTKSVIEIALLIGSSRNQSWEGYSLWFNSMKIRKNFEDNYFLQIFLEIVQKFLLILIKILNVLFIKYYIKVMFFNNKKDREQLKIFISYIIY